MVDTHGLQLIGLEYMNAHRVTYDAHIVNDLTMEEELPRIQRSADRPTILVHHNPVGLQHAHRGKIDAMLSGHTHGGQPVETCVERDRVTVAQSIRWMRTLTGPARSKIETSPVT